jgi:hypothetical protein
MVQNRLVLPGYLQQPDPFSLPLSIQGILSKAIGESKTVGSSTENFQHGRVFGCDRRGYFGGNGFYGWKIKVAFANILSIILNPK